MATFERYFTGDKATDAEKRNPYNSYGLLLAAHRPFEAAQKAIEEESSTDPDTLILETNDVRIRVRETVIGRNIAWQNKELQSLLGAYRAGLIQES